MKQKIKVLFTDLAYLEKNYGSQAIAFSFMEKFSEYFDAEYCFVLPENYYKDNLSFAKRHNFTIVASPNPMIVLSECSLLFYVLYGLAKFLIRGKKPVTKREKKQYISLVEQLKKSDVVIDLSGIEFIGNVNLRRRYANYINFVYMQRLSRKYHKPYFKYTKSYGPFPHRLHKSLAKKQLNKVPFVFVRGEKNLEEIKKLKLKNPVYSFPDISISMNPGNKSWAEGHLSRLGINISKPIIGLSPSTVIAETKTDSINSSCDQNHIELCKQIIKFFQSKNQQILLIPHSIDDGEDISCCDLALSKKIYSELQNKKNVFLLPDMLLTYKQVRAIIGLLNFYITGRYHGLSSALSMNIPVIALSWHIKYKDMMSLFLDDFLSIDCRTSGVQGSLSLIEKYYKKRDWFNEDKVKERKKKVLKKINESMEILVKSIKKQ